MGSTGYEDHLVTEGGWGDIGVELGHCGVLLPNEYEDSSKTKVFGIGISFINLGFDHRFIILVSGMIPHWRGE